MLIIRPPYDKALCPCLWHGTHLRQTRFHGYVLFISIFMLNHPLFHSWIVSLSLLVTIKCLRNGFMTRIAFFFRCHIEAQYHIRIYYGNFTVHYNTTAKHQRFQNTVTSHCPHTGDLCPTLHHSLHHAHFHINHMYFFLQEMFEASLP